MPYIFSRHFRFFFLIFPGLVSWAHASDKELWLGSIQRTLAHGAQPDVVLGVALVALALIGFLVLNEIRKAGARERASAKVSWEAFYARTREMKLDAPSIQTLEQMAKAARIGNALSLLTSAQVFEMAREAVYAEAGGVEHFPEHDLRAFRELRFRLGFSPLPVEAPFSSTRQFAPGMRLVIEVTEGLSSSTTIQNVDEVAWTVNHPFLGRNDVYAGMRVRLSMTRGGDAEYNLETEILQIRDRLLILRHTRQLSRRQLRNWVRVDVNLSARVTGLPGGTITGRIADLSGGGLALRLPKQVPVGGHLTLAFQIGDLSVTDQEGEVIRVVAMKGNSEDVFQHSVSFRDISKPVQERIVRYVFEKQREDAQFR
ncbi:MAG TPA: PilZ domain-containing protein [Fibrobacteraceae bacterium]|nr:PilZ domain-containing protein [Fibrobacteraceae bacterium]